ncbi:unnamed protein product [Adineta steineri]|uniref:Uncharacterized protein n=1 Tax=Adineta steineri TaxID=433720 RepID=A0A818Q746_9BILA|nr:unnamed protein product [Adineta steineri]CAF3636791.1 unnamed protein product [Adineta steineri]
MSLALHGHHILVIATLAFATAVLLPSWYTSPNDQIQRNVFDICTINPYSCRWTLLPTSDNITIRTIFPILVASTAIACAGISLIGLLFGSWYIQRYSDDIGSKWILILTTICVFLSFVLSCGVWAIMLTTNLHQNDTNIKAVRLEDFGFSLWINIGASGAYFYSFFIYLITACKHC